MPKPVSKPFGQSDETIGKYNLVAFRRLDKVIWRINAIDEEYCQGSAGDGEAGCCGVGRLRRVQRRCGDPNYWSIVNPTMATGHPHFIPHPTASLPAIDVPKCYAAAGAV